MAVVASCLACAAIGQEFVPFVIPARISSGQTVWATDFKPIETGSERLTAAAHFRRGGRDVRIWGVNLCFGGNFPTHEDAPYVAERLAAAGVNSVRCHHLDTSRWPRGIWNAENGKTIEPQALDRLDYLINELAKRGIFLNLNLHVGRAHSQYLGLPPTGTEFDKIAGIFTPVLIDAQRQYAKDLLTHANPYRSGVRYADDPAIAFVEITNEDSLFMWGAEEKLRTLPEYYTVSFQASSVQPRSISCNVSQAHESWANLGLSRRVDLGPEWKKFGLGFVAPASDNNARVCFVFGGNSTTFSLAQVEVRPGGQMGLVSGESASAGNVRLFQENESTPRILDRMVFLAETEKAYFDGMRSYIKKDLGCGALVTGTIVFGPLGLYAQSDMDYIDSHSYWQHPTFPGRPWDSANWLIEQRPMTDHPDQATLFRIAAERLAGKPFTLSEYNHPAPSGCSGGVRPDGGVFRRRTGLGWGLAFRLCQWIEQLGPPDDERVL